MVRGFRWCKKGCGKKVCFRPLTTEQRWGGKSFVCQTCGTRYKRSQLEKKCNKPNYIPTRKIPSVTKLYKMVIKNE